MLGLKASFKFNKQLLHEINSKQWQILLEYITNTHYNNRVSLKRPINYSCMLKLLQIMLHSHLTSLLYCNRARARAGSSTTDGLDRASIMHTRLLANECTANASTPTSLCKSECIINLHERAPLLSDDVT